MASTMLSKWCKRSFLHPPQGSGPPKTGQFSTPWGCISHRAPNTWEDNGKARWPGGGGAKLNATSGARFLRQVLWCVSLLSCFVVPCACLRNLDNLCLNSKMKAMVIVLSGWCRLPTVPTSSRRKILRNLTDCLPLSDIHVSEFAMTSLNRCRYNRPPKSIKSRNFGSEGKQK